MAKTIINMLDQGLKGKLFINWEKTSKEILLYESLNLNSSDLRYNLFFINFGQSDGKPVKTHINQMVHHKYHLISVKEANKINPYLKEGMKKWIESQPEGYEITLPEGI